MPGCSDATYNGASTYERAADATWELSYAAIERKASGAAQMSPEAVIAQNAIRLLNMLAFFQYDNVTDDIFRRAAEDKWRGLRHPLEVDPDGELAEGVNLPESLLMAMTRNVMLTPIAKRSACYALTRVCCYGHHPFYSGHHPGCNSK